MLVVVPKQSRARLVAGVSTWGNRLGEVVKKIGILSKTEIRIRAKGAIEWEPIQSEPRGRGLTADSNDSYGAAGPKFPAQAEHTKIVGGGHAFDFPGLHVEQAEVIFAGFACQTQSGVDGNLFSRLIDPDTA